MPTPASELTEKDHGRAAHYSWDDKKVRIRVGSLERVHRDGHDWIVLADGHIVAPGMPVTLEADDRIHGSGIVPDLDEGVYHADPLRHVGGSVSASMLKTLVKPGGPALLRERLANPPGPRPEFDFGHAVHTLVLGVGAKPVELPGSDLRHKATKLAAEQARSRGEIPLKPAEFAAAQSMAKAVKGLDVIRDGTPEVSLFHHDEDRDMWLRGRVDWLADDVIVDLKTTITADPHGFNREVGKFGYHLQAAFYLRLCAALGHPAKRFLFVAVEKSAPHLAAVHELDEEWLAIGAAEIERGLDLWECCRSGEWPGLPTHVHTLTPPVWMARPETDLTAIEAAFTELLGETA